MSRTERGNVAWRAGAPGGCLDRGGELVEGEVFGAADLEYAAAGRGVGHGFFGQRGDVCHRDEVDRVVSPSEDDKKPERAAVLAEHVDPPARRTRWPARSSSEPRWLAGASSAACFIRNSSIGLSAAAPGDRHQHQLSAGGSCGIDQVDVALVIDGGRGHAPRPGEPVDRGHDDAGTVEQPCPRLARSRTSPVATSTPSAARWPARAGSRVRTRTARPCPVSRVATMVPSGPVPPARRIISGRPARPAAAQPHRRPRHLPGLAPDRSRATGPRRRPRRRSPRRA